MSTNSNATLGDRMIKADEWLTVGDLAKLLTVHPDTIRRWAKSGRIKSRRHPINNYRLFLISDLMSIEKENE